MNLTPFVILWIALAVTVLALLVWRKAVARNEDDNLHVLDSAAVQQTALQTAVVKKLETIDRWGKIVTVVAVLYGVILGGLFIYQTWVVNTSIGV
jgi:uncharacterized membrane protein